MRLLAKFIRISHAKFHCNRFTTVQYIQDYASFVLAHSIHQPQRHGCGRFTPFICLNPHVGSKTSGFSADPGLFCLLNADIKQ